MSSKRKTTVKKKAATRGAGARKTTKRQTKIKPVGMRTVRASVSYEQDSQFPYQVSALRDPKKRRVDPFDTKEQRLLKHIETARLRDPLLQRAILYFDQIALGSGVTVRSDEESVKRAVDRFWDLNDCDDQQHRVAIECATTSNIFIRVPKVDKAAARNKGTYVPRIDPIPSCQITLIATKNGDPWYYRREWSEIEYDEPTTEPTEKERYKQRKTKTMYEDIPADEMVHVAMNRSVGELRGASLLAPALYWSQLYGRTLQTAWAMSVARSMWFVHAKIPATSSTQIDDFKSKVDDQLVEITDPQGQTYTSVPPGQVLVTDNQVDMSPLSSDVRAGTDDAQLRRLLLMVAVALGLPEFALSDGNYSNLASSMSQSAPFFRLMQAFQLTIIKALRLTLRKVLDRYIEAGVTFPLTSEEYAHPYETLIVDAPEILATDITSLASALATLVENNVISREEAATMLGADWETMREQIENESTQEYLKPPTPPAPGGPVLPFKKKKVAASEDPAYSDAEGKPRHEEIYHRAKQARAKLKERVEQFRREMLNADTEAEALTAQAAFVEEMKALTAELVTSARKAGVADAS